LAKSRTFRSLKQKKHQNYPIFYLFLNFDLAKGGASVPLPGCALQKYYIPWQWQSKGADGLQQRRPTSRGHHQK